MNFELSSEQRSFADSVERYLAEQYPFDARQLSLQTSAEQIQFSPQRWQQLAELGWLGLTLPEHTGGLAQEFTSAMPIMEGLGQHLVAEPCLNILECAPLLGDDHALLPALGQGQALAAFAHTEEGMHFDWLKITTTAKMQGEHCTLAGHKTAVAWGEAAQHWIVSAQTEHDGPSLWLVAATSPGVQVQPYRAIDGTPMARISFSATTVPAGNCLANGKEASKRIHQALAAGTAATCFEAVGAMSGLHALTLEYTKVRSQFGKTIGKFQAIAHRLVDMMVQIELSRSLAQLAASAVQDTQLSQEQRNMTLSAAKAHISASCRYVGEQAIQLHGGIGMTDECKASHYYRRLTALEKRCGDRHHHLGVLAEKIATGQTALYA